MTEFKNIYFEDKSYESDDFQAFRKEMQNLEDYFFENVCDADGKEDFICIYNADETECTVMVNSVDDKNNILYRCYISEEEAAGSPYDLLMKLLTTPVEISRNGNEVDVAVSTIWKTADGKIRTVSERMWVDRKTLDCIPEDDYE